MINSYKQLTVWQKAIDLVLQIYKLTDPFPKSEVYGLTNQMRRAAVSIPANIAEGSARGHRQEYCHFVRIAYASGAELETHLIIARQLGFGSPAKLQKAEALLDEVMRMANALARTLSTRR
ncbi:four helix bundle protein [Candidatus Parcubacteria bacterium]|nr:MAG: four helix bundle protein [Candidatus Parcubacteria bacterium]